MYKGIGIFISKIGLLFACINIGVFFVWFRLVEYGYYGAKDPASAEVDILFYFIITSLISAVINCILIIVALLHIHKQSSYVNSLLINTIGIFISGIGFISVLLIDALLF